jgi:hypothetical protein
MLDNRHNGGMDTDNGSQRSASDDSGMGTSS